jgi:hypothetical protein
MECNHHQELEALRAELAATRAALDMAQETIQIQARAMACQAEAMVTLASNARSVTGQRYSVTANVTQEEEKKERKRELGRVRQQNFRVRHAQRYGNAASAGVDQRYSPSPSSSIPADSRGALRAVTPLAARHSQRYGVTDAGGQRPRIHRTADTLPPAVAELRAGWNRLVAPHGFPEWDQTSDQLVRDAEAALERRPLEEWLRVFGLVPRSKVCRGELGSRQRASVVYILSGPERGKDGYEPADKLLSGYWEIDPPREVNGDDEPGDVIALEHLAPGPEGDAALAAWQHVIGLLRAAGKFETLKSVDSIAPARVTDGQLELICSDKFAGAWVRDMFLESLTGYVAPLGLTGVRLMLPGGIALEDADGPPPPDEPGQGTM